MSVLQEGRARRPRTPPARHRIEQAAAIVFLALIALLAVMASQASGPAALAVRAPAVHHVAVVKAPVRSDYGIAPAPAAEQVSANLKLPLGSGLLFDVRTGQVLWARDPAQIVPIASLTKI
jgi:D-alanyl-D-alanine carboxypeptidase